MPNDDVNLIISSVQSSFPRRFNSWEILSDKVALKTVDKSVFINHDSGIPKGTREFFNIANMKAGYCKDIKLKCNGKFYDAYFRFKKIDQYNFNVHLIIFDDIEEDIDSEEVGIHLNSMTN